MKNKNDIEVNDRINVYFYNEKDVDEMGVRFLGFKTQSVIVVQRTDKKLIYLQGWIKIEQMRKNKMFSRLLED